MAYFRKPTRRSPPAPKTCDRCRERIGKIRIHSVSSAAVVLVAENRTEDWWLCEECAQAIRPDDPTRS